MPKLQNFSATRNNDEAISVVIDSSVAADTLEGATVTWAVYEMEFAVPIMSPQLIVKSSADGGISVPGSPDLFFIINLNAVDTVGLDLGNYYHEGMVVDEVGHRVTVVYGALAVTLEVMG
jgi:hypothetical protein